MEFIYALNVTVKPLLGFDHWIRQRVYELCFNLNEIPSHAHSHTSNSCIIYRASTHPLSQLPWSEQKLFVIEWRKSG